MLLSYFPRVTLRVILPAVSCTEPFDFCLVPFACRLRFLVALPTAFFTLPAALFALPLACVLPPAILTTSDKGVPARPRTNPRRAESTLCPDQARSHQLTERATLILRFRS